MTKRCYFCSRSLAPDSEPTARLKGQDAVQLACGVCRHALRTEGRAKILSYTVAGQSFHWSQTEAYDPTKGTASEWDINLLKSTEPKKKPTLKVVR